jgi:hypothetical protein
VSDYEALIIKARDIVSRGCGCDHSCEGIIADCGCYDDAKKIVELVLDAVAPEDEQP